MTQVRPQKMLNGEVHDWYRMIHGYSDHLVAGLLDEFELRRTDRVLDPFCGAGTTLVECMKHGIDSIGIDANPASCYAARAKTDWSLVPQRLLELCGELADRYGKHSRRNETWRRDPTYVYLEDAGFIKRGWISPEPAKAAIVLKKSIADLETNHRYKRAFMLALMSELVNSISNVKFGPEIYCALPKKDADALTAVRNRVERIAEDLSIAQGFPHGRAVVATGDSRQCDTVLRTTTPRKVTAVICSPPYPTEHDYTRNTRLELALLEAVTSKETLRSIKKQMIRSHTKGIYKDDKDAHHVSNIPEVERIASNLDERVKNIDHRKDGFARFYPTVIREYFGGMKRHFVSVRKRLTKGARCAYVVGDQCSYMNVLVPTATVLAAIAEQVGFDVIEVRRWRRRLSTTTQRYLDENVLVLRHRASRDS